MPSKKESKWTEFLFIFIFSFVLAELALKFVHYPLNREPPNPLPGSIESDPVLGWKHKPGTYQFFGPNSKKPFTVTYLPDGSRATSDIPRQKSDHQVLLLGCSFMEGFGLDDHDSIGWQLQERTPSLHIINLGTGGYGTYQSMLRMEDFIKKSGKHPDQIIYGFGDFHTFRNVQNPLTQRYWHQPGIYPYCDYDSCQTWEGKQTGWLSAYFRLFSLIENTKDFLSMTSKEGDAKSITLNLIQTMQKKAEATGSKFMVAILTPANDRWSQLFQKRKIPFADCYQPGFENLEYRLPDGHPNPKLSQKFAECMEKIIRINNSTS